jgi:ubiquinone/menaquinone biosynthesis C-methylase UbiE
MVISISGQTSATRWVEMSDDIKTELRRTWESAAPGWAKWEDVIAAGLADATETMLDAARVGAGMRVLDLACGAGSQTLQAAERVGPKGRVVATDISATMLTHVREAAARRTLSNRNPRMRSRGSP